MFFLNHKKSISLNQINSHPFNQISTSVNWILTRATLDTNVSTPLDRLSASRPDLISHRMNRKRFYVANAPKRTNEENESWKQEKQTEENGKLLWWWFTRISRQIQKTTEKFLKFSWTFPCPITFKLSPNELSFVNTPGTLLMTFFSRLWIETSLFIWQNRKSLESQVRWRLSSLPRSMCWWVYENIFKKRH